MKNKREQERLDAELREEQQIEEGLETQERREREMYWQYISAIYDGLEECNILFRTKKGMLVFLVLELEMPVSLLYAMGRPPRLIVKDSVREIQSRYSSPLDIDDWWED